MPVDIPIMYFSCNYVFLAAGELVLLPVLADSRHANSFMLTSSNPSSLLSSSGSLFDLFFTQHVPDIPLLQVFYLCY